MSCVILLFSLSTVFVLQETVLFWNPTNETKQRRLKRFTVPLESQAEFESEK